jgi:hypothetical protein
LVDGAGFGRPHSIQNASAYPHKYAPFLLYSAMAVSCTSSIRKRTGNDNRNFRERSFNLTGIKKMTLDREVFGQSYDWPPYSDKSKPVCFWVITNVNLELTVLGMEGNLRTEVIQRLKKKSLKDLKLRGNMLNLREKHIPRMKEIFRSVLDSFVIQD